VLTLALPAFMKNSRQTYGWDSYFSQTVAGQGIVLFFAIYTFELNETFA